ncbi:SPRY-domain-containing protein [Dunaliella salina]|uniref:SPRY-domain-containing protein n=1 Tax=Dunaliella salina TaxID=3046 RepID=A0ABQ7HAM9_DUNSA|nr:SPRY-domain-containing protein [Dunaliella salina]|eukprot:KAF5843911.1 SPRY-domain-containing protein [Dunaliella salina]
MSFMMLGGADPGKSFEAEPSCLNTTATGHGVEIGRDKLSVRYLADGRHSNDVGSVMANRPVPRSRCIYYYEVQVVEQGDAGRIAVGFADARFKLTRQPGWEANSYGYHGDDGQKYSSSGKGEEYGPMFGTGDVIGAGIHLSRKEIFFTKNGVKLKTAFRNVRGVLYPVIGLHSKNESVRVNFQGPFRFDIEGMILDEKALQRQALQRIAVDPGDVQALVRGFLSHCGYAATLAAFDAAAGGPGDSFPPPVYPPQGPTGMEVESGPSQDGIASTAGNMDVEQGGAMPTAMDAAQGLSNGDAESNGTKDRDNDALLLRHEVRNLIINGNVVGAIQRIRDTFPQVLEAGSGFEVVQFHLYCQHYIELLRQGHVSQAVSYAQTTLAEIRKAVPMLEDALQEVVALIAYEDPQASPLSHYLGPHQRERVADVANLGLLINARGESSSVVPKSALERCLQQVVVVNRQLLEINGGGVPLLLSDILTNE